MAKTPPSSSGSSDDKKKPGFFSSLSGAINDVVNEVKADLASMTPPEPVKNPKADAAREANSSRILGLVGQAALGMAEEVVDGPVDEAETPAPAAPVATAGKTPEHAVPQGMPAGNMWENMAIPAVGLRFMGDVCYHALTPADVDTYVRALNLENQAPFTIGIAAISLQGYAEDEGEELGDDILFLTLQKALQESPRLYGAIGAGPRHLWDNLDLLDETLTARLNDNPKILAIGPVGLDEPFAPYAIAQQKAQLALQLDIAADFGMPVLLTYRQSMEALKDVLQHATRLPPLISMVPVETAEQMELVEQFNMFALVRPELTNPAFAGAGFYASIPIEKLVLGSGSALVAPHGFSGHFNQPKFLKNSLQACARMRRTPENTLQLALNGTMSRIFYQAES
jgi:Tat protein secretion system quality control protein TatD with DNase activity